MKGKKPSQRAITRQEHKNQDVAELLLRLSPYDPEDIQKARQIAKDYFLLEGKALEEFIEKWSAYSDDA